MKPNKLTIKKYLAFLLKNFIDKQMERAKERRRRRLAKKRGYWYCAHCDTMHGPRIIEYSIFGGTVDSVCSIGKQEYLAWVPEAEEDEPYTEDDFTPFVRGIEFTITEERP